MRFLTFTRLKIMSSLPFIIVIGRQFGCGGQELGKLLAERMGVPYYDKNLLNEAAKRMGFDTAIFDRADERKPSFFRSILSLNYGATSPDTMNNYLCNEQLYAVQSDVIRRLASEGTCIFVGRTADYITREMPGLVSIFLHADITDRAKRICSRCDCTDFDNAIELARKKDKLREEYYNYFTGRNWGQAANYDLCFNTSKMEISEIADIIINHINHKKQTL